MLSRDTSTEVAAKARERIRKLSMAQRMEEGVRLCRFAREVMRAGIRQRHPEYCADQVEMALARLLWGDALYQQARPGWPLLAP